MSHTNDIHQRTTQSVSLPTSVNLSTCQVLIAVFVVYPHSVPSHVTLHCYLSVYCTHGWLVGCIGLSLVTELTEHNSLTVSSHHWYLSCEPQSSRHFQVNPPLSLSIPNIYYETTLYNSSHQIIYSTYTQMSSVSCQISRPLLAVLHCWLVCQTLNSVAVCIYIPNAVIFSVTLSSPEPTYLKCTPGGLSRVSKLNVTQALSCYQLSPYVSAEPWSIRHFLTPLTLSIPTTHLRTPSARCQISRLLLAALCVVGLSVKHLTL